jgi:hypothetical protein
VRPNYEFQNHTGSDGYWRGNLNRNSRTANLSLTPFDGKDEWDIWISRFEAIAKRYNWDTEEKLDQLLPRLQGSAGQFVFGQLPQDIIENYHLLIRELDSRFRVIRTSRSYAAKFSKRQQLEHETPEEYAAELKMLYDKAHGYRDRRTRQEDLVRKFLDGLQDEEVRFAVEYQKEPEDIDEAVFHVANYVQTKVCRRQEEGDKRNKKTRRASYDREDDGNDSNEIRQLKRGNDKMLVRNTENMTRCSSTETNENTTNEGNLSKVLEQILTEVTKFNHTNNMSANKDKTKEKKSIVCFNCGKQGHIARECRKNRRGPETDGNQRQKYSYNYATYREANVSTNPLNMTGPALGAKERSQTQ